MDIWSSQVPIENTPMLEAKMDAGDVCSTQDERTAGQSVSWCMSLQGEPKTLTNIAQQTMNVQISDTSNLLLRVRKFLLRPLFRSLVAKLVGRNE